MLYFYTRILWTSYTKRLWQYSSSFLLICFFLLSLPWRRTMKHSLRNLLFLRNLMMFNLGTECHCRLENTWCDIDACIYQERIVSIHGGPFLTCQKLLLPSTDFHHFFRKAQPAFLSGLHLPHWMLKYWFDFARKERPEPVESHSVQNSLTTIESPNLYY